MRLSPLLALVLASTAMAAEPPALTLWAWERPEDLRFLEPGEASVAYLAATVRVSGASVSAVPRRQPLRVRDGTSVIAVVRIEAEGVPSAETVTRVAEDVIRLGTRDGVCALQLDFDAKESQRPSQLLLLKEVRGRLPHGMRLESTALASWCLFDDWACELAQVADVVVPMVFRMGADDERVRRALAGGEPWTCAACARNVGIATDEEMPRLPDAARVHAFAARSWTRADVDRVQAAVTR